jgi:hypothetical protein
LPSRAKCIAGPSERGEGRRKRKTRKRKGKRKKKRRDERAVAEGERWVGKFAGVEYSSSFPRSGAGACRIGL